MAGKVYDGERNEGNRERNTGNREQGIEALYSHTRDPERDARFRVPRSRFPVPGSPFPVPRSRFPYPWINALICATTAAAMRSGA